MSQASLTDIDYEPHTVEQPPEDRVKEDHLTYEEIFSCEVGDVIWVDGVTMTICGRGPSFFNPGSLIVITEDGFQGELVGGKLSTNSNTCGMAWMETVRNKPDDEEYTKSDLICEYNRVYKLRAKDYERLHNIVPNTDSKVCNLCDTTNSGKIVRTEKQADKLVEIRKCLNCDRVNVFRHVKKYPHNEQSEIIVREDERYNEESSFEILTINGVYHAETQDDFRFPLDTHDGIDHGFHTATEIAESRNSVMFGEGITDILNSENITPRQVIDLLTFKREEQSSTGPEEIEIVKYGDICNHVFNNRYPPKSIEDSFNKEIKNNSNKGLIDVLNKLDDAEVFIKTFDFLSRTDFADYSIRTHRNLPISFEQGCRAVREKLAEVHESVPHLDENQAINEKTKTVLDNIFSKSMTGRDILTNPAFTILYDNMSYDHKDRIKTKNVENHSSDKRETVITWKDAPRLDKKMKNTYTKVDKTPTEPFKISFKWSMEEYDLTDHIIPK
jgi:hypothetical protein